MMWPILQVRYMLKTKLNYHNWLDRGQSVKKTKKDNNVTNCTCAVYVENDIKLLGPIRLGAIYDETRQDKDVTNRKGVIYVKSNSELSWPIWLGGVYSENEIEL